MSKPHYEEVVAALKRTLDALDAVIGALPREQRDVAKAGNNAWHSGFTTYLHATAATAREAERERLGP